MAKNKNVKINNLSKAIRDIVQEYADGVDEGVDRVAAQAVEDLVQKTKATAPKRTGSYRKNIASQKSQDVKGAKYIWYVKKPDYRLTHLLVHGHATRNGGRTKKNPFLQNALKSVLSDFEKNLQEVVKNGK